MKLEATFCCVIECPSASDNGQDDEKCEWSTTEDNDAGLTATAVKRDKVGTTVELPMYAT